MVDVRGGVLCIYCIDDGEFCQHGVAGPPYDGLAQGGGYKFSSVVEAMHCLTPVTCLYSQPSRPYW
jgi:hypothetical protein